MSDGAEVMVEELTQQQGADLFDAACRNILDVTVGDFLDAYDSGLAWDRWEHDAVTQLSMLIPFVRTTKSA